MSDLRDLLRDLVVRVLHDPTDGSVRSGPYAHYCCEWDEMLIDETDPEFDACTCFPRYGPRKEV